MGLISFGVITLALFVALFQIQADYQYTWIIRGYVVYALYAFGLRLSHVSGLLESAVGAVKAIATHATL